MRRRLGQGRPLVALAVALGSVAGLATSARAATASGVEQWQDGWDISGLLDLANSNVAWTQPTNNSLDATYNFVGADPNSQYTVGIALLYESSSGCLSSFGQFSLGPCYDVTRQGFTSWEDDTNGVSPGGTGRLMTDGSGDGSVTVDFTRVAPGNYMLKFYAREGNGDGSIEFQAPGPFEQTIDLTFSALPTTADQCKESGWQAYGVFKNQGDCVSYVATQGKNPPRGG